MKILGHRGASADFPENTLAAFDAAVKQGADGVELDVMRCSTGELVVCHDEVLQRLAGLQWKVALTPWWKLKTVDVGSRLGFAPAHIPLLREVFELLPDHLLINVELKCDELNDRGLSVAAGRLIDEQGWGERALFSSFNPLCLIRLAERYPAVEARPADRPRQVVAAAGGVGADHRPRFDAPGGNRLHPRARRGLAPARPDSRGVDGR